MTAVHRHHRKLRRHKDESPENILEVGVELHDAIHRNVALAYEHGLLVHSWDDPAEIEADVEGFTAALREAYAAR